MGIRLCEAIQAFSEERYDEATDVLMSLRYDIVRIGGSGAQVCIERYGEATDIPMPLRFRCWRYRVDYVSTLVPCHTSFTSFSSSILRGWLYRVDSLYLQSLKYLRHAAQGFGGIRCLKCERPTDMCKQCSPHSWYTYIYIRTNFWTSYFSDFREMYLSRC